VTPLRNRSLFFDRLGQTLALGRRDGTPGALMFLDLDHFKEVNDAVRVANNIIAAIGKPFQIAGAEARVGVSIGIALFPQHGDTVERILNAADNAMYRSKNAGRNCYTFASADVAPTAVQGTP